MAAARARSAKHAPASRSQLCTLFALLFDAFRRSIGDHPLHFLHQLGRNLCRPSACEPHAGRLVMPHSRLRKPCNQPEMALHPRLRPRELLGRAMPLVQPCSAAYHGAQAARLGRLVGLALRF